MAELDHATTITAAGELGVADGLWLTVDQAHITLRPFGRDAV